MGLVVRNLVKNYGKQQALKGVSFEIQQSGIIGLLGPNGAGKSTLMKIIVGFLEANGGEVVINEKTNAQHTTQYRQMIGYLPENNPLYNEMYIREYFTFVAKVKGLKSGAAQEVEKLIAQVGLTPEVHKHIGELSKGYRQRVGLASALLGNPSVLILDEPTTGLDPLQILEIRELIKSISKEKIVILSTHIMQEVQALCDRILIIKKGEIIADEQSGNVASLLKSGKNIITIEFEHIQEASVFGTISGVDSVTVLDGNKVVIEAQSERDIRSDIFKCAVQNNLVILSVSLKEISMEEIFQEIAG